MGREKENIGLVVDIDIDGNWEEGKLWVGGGFMGFDVANELPGIRSAAVSSQQDFDTWWANHGSTSRKAYYSGLSTTQKGKCRAVCLA